MKKNILLLILALSVPIILIILLSNQEIKEREKAPITNRVEKNNKKILPNRNNQDNPHFSLRDNEYLKPIEIDKTLPKKDEQSPALGDAKLKAKLLAYDYFTKDGTNIGVSKDDFINKAGVSLRKDGSYLVWSDYGYCEATDSFIRLDRVNEDLKVAKDNIPEGMSIKEYVEKNYNIISIEKAIRLAEDYVSVRYSLFRSNNFKLKRAEIESSYGVGYLIAWEEQPVGQEIIYPNWVGVKMNPVNGTVFYYYESRYEIPFYNAPAISKDYAKFLIRESIKTEFEPSGDRKLIGEIEPELKIIPLDNKSGNLVWETYFHFTDDAEQIYHIVVDANDGSIVSKEFYPSGSTSSNH